MRLADYVFRYLKDYGVKHVFMLSGGGAMYLNDALGKSGIPYTCNLHEQACAICASAYAQYNNTLGVCSVTTAPGGTNTITGVAGAWLDSVPLLVISGQVKRNDMKKGKLRQRGFQELDVVKIVSSITKYAFTIKEPQDIKYHLDKAVYLATHGRPAPVWLDIPLDVQGAEVDEKSLHRFSNGLSNEKIPLMIQTMGTINYLNHAKKPVIIMGNGMRLANSSDKFLKLVESLNIPVLTTWRAIDFMDENDPVFCGRPGIVGQRGANIIQQSADCILSIGARLDYGQIGYEQDKFAPKSRKIIVDVDGCELDKLKHIDLPICVDANDFINEILVQQHSIKPRDDSWLLHCKNLKASYPVVLPEYYETKGYLADDKVNLYAFIDCLSKLMSEDDVLVPASSGQAAEVTMQSFKVKKGQRVLNFPALGSMGFGICSAIGACLASGKRTICIEGDGSFAMNTQELETIRRLRLPIKIFVLNNYGYGSIRSTQKSFFEGRLVGSDCDSGLTLPSISGIAKAYGIGCDKIRGNFRLEEWVNEWMNNTDDDPYIIEVMVDPNQRTVPKVASKLNSDGTFEQNPFEEMTY